MKCTERDVLDDVGALNGIGDASVTNSDLLVITVEDTAGTARRES